MNRDFMGIVLEMGQNSNDPNVRSLYEDVRDGRFVDLSMYDLSQEGLNESVTEPLSSQGLKVVKEKYGSGVSLTVGNKELRLVSDKYTTEELERKVSLLLEHQEESKVQEWIKGNTLCYFSQSLSEEVEEVVEEPLEESKEETSQDININEDTQYEGFTLKWVSDKNGGKHVNVYKEREFKGSFDDANEAKRAIRNGEFEESVDEATQASDAATKVDDSVQAIVPVAGKAYEFPDGLYVVDSVIDGEVYLVGPDDEYYSISVEDFEKEVITPLEEAELEDEAKYESLVKKNFQGWVLEKVNNDTDKTGIVMYALAKGDNDVVVFIHLGEEEYEIYSESDEDAPDYEGKLDYIENDLRRMSRHFE